MSDPLILLTDPPPMPADRRCPECGSTQRHRSETMGPVHDVCSGCYRDFAELTVPEQPEVEGDEGW